MPRKTPVFRCPTCLTVDISRSDLGNKCPCCNNYIPADLEPSYYKNDFEKDLAGSQVKQKPSVARLASGKKVKSAIYRCPSCLSTKVSVSDLGNVCPSCYGSLPSDLKPAYYGKLNAFKNPYRSTKFAQPTIVTIFVLLALGALGYLAVDRSSQKELIGGSKTSPILKPTLPGISRISFEQITNCFQLLQYLQQEGWEMQYLTNGNYWESLGKVIGIINIDSLALNITKTASRNQFIEIFSLVETQCRKSERDLISSRTPDLRYSEFVQMLAEDNSIRSVSIYTVLGSADISLGDGSRKIVTLAPDKDLTGLLKRSGVNYSIQDLPQEVTAFNQCVASLRSDLIAQDPYALKQTSKLVQATLLQADNLPSNPKICSYILPSQYLTKAIVGSYGQFNAKVTKLTDGTIVFTPSR